MGEINTNPPKVEIPSASSFQKPRKAGHLTKLCGRRWFFRAAWKRRYCVLDGTKLYYYENETSKGTENSCGVISLDYYDICEEQESKKTPNVFTIKTSVRGFFEINHVFSADTLSDMCDWIGTILATIQEARGNRTRSKRNSVPKENSQKGTNMQDLNNGENSTLDLPREKCLSSATRNRARPPPRRLPNRKTHQQHPLSDVDETPLSPVSTVIEHSLIQEELQEEIKRNSVRVYDYSSSEESASPDPSGGSPHLRKNSSRKNKDILPALGSRHVSQPEMLNEANMTNGTGDSPTLETKENPRWTVSSSCLPKPRHPATGAGLLSPAVELRLLQINDRLGTLEKDINVARGDIGSVQENLTTIHSNMESATEKVTDVTQQAQMFENQMTTLLQEIQAMFNEASCLVKEAKQAKEEYLNLKNICSTNGSDES